jgi:hypothetical protein
MKSLLKSAVAAAAVLLGCFLAPPCSADIIGFQAAVSPQPATELDRLDLHVTFATDPGETATATVTFQGKTIDLDCTSSVSGNRRSFDCNGNTAPDSLLLLPPGTYPLTVHVESRQASDDSLSDQQDQELSVEVIIPDIPTLSDVIDRMAAVRPRLVAQQMVRPLERKLAAAQAALNRGKKNGPKTALNILRAFRNQVRAQRGKKINRLAADKLTADANSLAQQISNTH